jgi:threonine dehydrogenase-like Zn-dependent dehydrogenase
MEAMQGITVPGDSSIALVEFPVPTPAYDEVLIEVRSSGLCGSDIHAYRRPKSHNDPRAGMIGGHEPSGVVVALGDGVTNYRVGDRVFAYHISGCGHCHNCRLGYMQNCTSPLRAAYGEHRHGGHARFMAATERTLIHLPEPLTFLDGAMLACTAATAYGACLRADLSARDCVLITGLGPVGLTTALFAMAHQAEVIVTDINDERLTYARELGVPHVLRPDEAPEALPVITKGRGPSVTIECSGSDSARHLCLQEIATWGRAIFVGFGGRALTIDVGPLVIQKQVTVRGSFVSSIGQMEDAAHFLARHNLHPGRLSSGDFGLAQAAEVYSMFAAGAPGKFSFTPRA